MKINDWLSAAQKQLAEAGIESARLDALILLEDCLQLDRAYLLAHDDAELASENIAILQDRLARRSQHEPLAYIRGFCEFYGRPFFVSKSVLVPRPESEDIITLLKKHAATATSIADIGTGSGALAITAAHETKATVYAVDIDAGCLQVTEQNAAAHGVSIGIAKGNLLEPFLQDSNVAAPEVLLANLPYVPHEHPINDAARHEPKHALFGGSDGLDLYRTMFDQIKQLTTKPTIVITESLPSQHTALAEIAQIHSYTQAEIQGYVQAFTLQA